MKKTTSRILLSALTVLALLSLSGCAQEKEENTKQSDPQAREAILQCCETIFGSTEETGTYHIRVTDERDGGRVDEYDCPRGADEQGYGNSPVYALSETVDVRRRAVVCGGGAGLGRLPQRGRCGDFLWGRCDRVHSALGSNETGCRVRASGRQCAAADAKRRDYLL